MKRLPSQEVVSIDELAALKNNVADAVIAQEAPPKGMLSWFLEMYADSKQGDLWRGYIVQKMAEIIQRLKSPDDVKRGVYFLWSQLRAQHPIEAALGLDRLHEARPDLVSKEELVRSFGALLAGMEPSQQLKRVVLQLFGKYDTTGARREAIRFLRDKDSELMLKASALATLGQVGNVEDKGLIEPYVSSPDIRLSTAASVALKRVSAR